MQFHCYIPCTDAQLARMPKALADYVAWQNSEVEPNPYLGRFHWVLQTQLQLHIAGLDLRLTNRIDSAGYKFTPCESLARSNGGTLAGCKCVKPAKLHLRPRVKRERTVKSEAGW